MKSKGLREMYIQLNKEFQRRAQRDKNAFFNEQCIKLEENSRKGNTVDLFRKIINVKGTFHPKMVTSKGRDQVDTEEFMKWWTEYMEELYEKILMNWIFMMVWTVTQSQTFWSVKSRGP